MKKFFIIIGSVAASILAIMLIIVFLFWMAFGGANYFIQIPKPEVTYGEFPFKLTYELNGEIKTIEDTIVCEFDGFEVVGESGKYRRWKEYLKSGKEQLTLLDLRPLKEINEFGQTMLELYFFYGTAAYYMGDESSPYARSGQKLDYVSYKYQTVDGIVGGSGYNADVAWEKYKIKIISWEVAPPIQNIFK